MKILYYDFLDLERSQYGCAVHIFEVAKYFQKLGNTVAFLNHRSPRLELFDSNLGRAFQHSKKLLLWDWVERRSALMGILFELLNETRKVIMGLRVVLGGFRPDVIYTRNNICNSGHVLSLLFKVPLVEEVDSILSVERQFDRISGIALSIASRIEKATLPKADRIIVITIEQKDSLVAECDVPEDKIAVIPVGANTELFKPLNEAKSKLELKLDDQASYICHVGSLSRLTGLEYVVESLPYILREVPAARLLIVGGGGMEEELKALAQRMGIADEVIFTGIVPYEHVPLYINASKICLIYRKPLSTGYSPLKLHEYMACGKPIVASKVSGFDILEEEDLGVLVAPGHPDALADAIIQLLKDPHRMTRLGQNSRAYAAAHHSWESITERIVEECNAVVQKAR